MQSQSENDGNVGTIASMVQLDDKALTARNGGGIKLLDPVSFLLFFSALFVDRPIP
jgi:hypothetical protein